MQNLKRLDREEQRFLAHTSPVVGGDGQPIAEHLRNVGSLAGQYASWFSAGELAEAAGLWHDIGKYSEAFQDYLAAAVQPDVHRGDALPRTDHSTAGAQHAASRFPRVGHLLAYVIAGHHAGLPDADSPGSSSLRARLRKSVEPWEDAAPPSIRNLTEPAPPDFLLEHLQHPHRPASALGIALFTRMIFSVLVDADFLDTEAFMSPDRAAERGDWPDDVIDRMLAALEQRIASFGPPAGEVNLRRAEVAEACRAGASRPPGLFTLTVPTGGGKTLSSLLFALGHARAHGLRRVIYVAPFTSIIEQNAEVYRDVMASLVAEGVPDPVVEHHSNLDPDRETDQSRRATENWAAPLVVTTAVQFYESLFANRSSRCRKLHNLARSVVILDEAQSLPVSFLAPCLRVIEALARDYGTSLVLCTATQPAIRKSPAFEIGLTLSDGTEIIPNVSGLFEALKRVEVEYAGHLSDEDVLDHLREQDQVLCIVNTRKHARALAEALGEEVGHFHLSALMCPAHRTKVLREIRARLDAGEVCRVVSTQLIEAGVDVDFPAVYRALAGLDSIAQAAGRCNRNGRRPRAPTTVFETDHTSAERFIAHQVASARQVLDAHEDLLSPPAVEHYFRVHYWEQKHQWDRQGILDCFTLDGGGALPFHFQFRKAAAEFRLIDSEGVPVIVPWGAEGEDLCRELREAWTTPSMKLLRRLQRFTVQIPERVWVKEGSTSFEVLHEQFPVLAFPQTRYSSLYGLDLAADVGTELVT